MRFHLWDTDHSEVQELFLLEAENPVTDALLNQLTDLYSVAAELQSDCTLLLDCQVFFNGFLEKYSSMKDKLGDKISMVLNHHFEETIRKTHRGEEFELKGVQQRATQHLQKKHDLDAIPKTLFTPMSFAKRLQSVCSRCRRITVIVRSLNM